MQELRWSPLALEAEAVHEEAWMVMEVHLICSFLVEKRAYLVEEGEYP